MAQSFLAVVVESQNQVGVHHATSSTGASWRWM